MCSRRGKPSRTAARCSDSAQSVAGVRRIRVTKIGIFTCLYAHEKLNMYDLLIIGAGPGGIALAAEAQASGIDPSRTLVLEKAATHNWAIRQLYPEQKLTTANYKGF